MAHRPPTPARSATTATNGAEVGSDANHAPVGAGRDYGGQNGKLLYPSADLRCGNRCHYGARRGICGFLLPISQFPEIAPPQVVVTASYPGASGQVVADTVTTPLEQQINGVTGMTYMASTSSNDGSSTITITFDVGYSLDIAAVDVQNRVSQAAASLPPIVNQGGITIRKQNPGFVLLVNLFSPDNSVDPSLLATTPTPRSSTR